MYFLDSLSRLLEPFGVIAQVGAGFVAVILVVAALGFLRRAVEQFVSLRISDEPIFVTVTRWAPPAFIALVLIVGALIASWLAITPMQEVLDWVIAYVTVFLFGGAVGAAELISRYKDQPERAVCTTPAIFYILLNAFGAVAALYLIYVFRQELGFAEGQPPEWPIGNNVLLVKAVLIAGFSSLLFFRTSIFKFRVGDSDLSIGPSIVLDTLLFAADRAVDRVMAEPRAQIVHDVMGNIAFEKAAAILPAHCLALMQNVSGDESQRIVGVVNSLRADTEMPDKIKSLNLGLSLLTVVGEDVLRTAVNGLNKDLEDSTALLMGRIREVMERVSFKEARKMLPPYCFAMWPKTIPEKDRDQFNADIKALDMIQDVPEQYKSLILGVWLAKLTDGKTLSKAVSDLETSIKADQP